MPRALYQAATGDILVLDADWKRVFVFDSAGTLTRTIGEGFGTAKGAFLLPIDMDVSPTGEVFVVDYERKDVTVFDIGGTLKRVFSLGRVTPARIAVTADRVWITRAASRPDSALAVFSLDGTARGKALGIGGDYAMYGRNGNLGTAVRLASNELAFAFAPAGKWAVLKDGEWKAYGMETLPGRVIARRGEFRDTVPPRIAIDVAPVGSDQIAILYREVRVVKRSLLESVRSPRRDSIALTHGVVFFGRNGCLIASAGVPNGDRELVLFIAAIRGSPDIAVGTKVPVPHIVQYRLAPASANADSKAGKTWGELGSSRALSEPTRRRERED